jgi:class 3 adenylate cyclase
VLPLSFVWNDTNLRAAVATVGLALVPISVVTAIVRHRLYEIDRILNRTLVYGGATIVLAAAFGIANLGAQRALETVTGQRSDVVTAALAVVAALAFGPIRRWMRPAVDRFLPARAELTLLFTDIVGSTRLAAEMGDERWRGMLDRFRAAVRRELRRFDGREIDTAGDAFFATFEQPEAGLTCAVAIRAAVQQLHLGTRTGLHVGECEMRGETVSGLAVHVAARVMAGANPGEILLSDALRDAAAGLRLPLHDCGRRELKGVPGDRHLYRLEGAGRPA